ncbi:MULTISPECIES: daptide-type RiPP biosynthesis aminotransferase [Streptomyces]|uniref:Aminotransferase n=1 Tax=Streptomyces alboflavus TaxID=67267 RepID=A0A1Z1WEW2_9ACTN|nr:daptide-type RiPP biosynthesis aminotransferase [Streptomyces alboflavus]ARX84971.1 aminotransferase [Streptomyces alboflavus]
MSPAAPTPLNAPAAVNAPAAPTAPGTHYPLWESLLPAAEQGRIERCAVGAKGSRLRFADASEVLDATSGLWNVNIGYGNAAIADAIAQACRDASYLNLFRYSHTYALQAARDLVNAAGPEAYRRVVFATSGGSANDLAMKLARQYAVLRGQPERRLVVGLKGSYHGLTYGAHSLTGEALGQQMYGVDLRNVRHVDPSSPDELERFMKRHGSQVASLVCEPVLGSGVHPLSAEFVDAVLKLRREYGFLLVADEVATGFGRTGPLFASSAWAESPDLLLTSKGLTNGTCAASAVLVSHAIAEAFERHDTVLMHAETQAGTPASCAAITTTLEQFAELDVLAASARTAERLDTLLAELTERIPAVHSTSGVGCFRAVHLRDADGDRFDGQAVQDVIAAVRDHGALVYPGPGCVQLVPMLTSSEQDLDDLAHALLRGLAAVGRR